jgi:hypothetical protein
MDANSFPGAETIGQPSRKCPERSLVLRKMSVGNRIREKLQPDLLGKAALFRESKQMGFLLFQKRNQSFNASNLHSEQFIAQSTAAWRTEHDSQRRGRIAADPEDVLHAG